MPPTRAAAHMAGRGVLFLRPVCVWLLEREGREGEGLRGKRRSEEEEVGKKEGKKKKKTADV